MTDAPLPQWVTTETEPVNFNPSKIEKQSHRFSRRIRLRNIAEYAAGALALILFSRLSIGAFAKGEAMIGWAGALIVIGVGVVLWQLHARASVPAQQLEVSCLEYMRAQYLRQYKALRSIPLWYLGPLVPGIVAFYYAVTARVAEAVGWTAALEGIVVPASATLGLFLAIATANWLAARALKRKLESMSELA